MKRTNKEIKLNINDSCNILYGTTNKFNPKVVYLSCNTWVNPNETKDFNDIFNKIFSNFKKELFNNISMSKIFDKNFITNFEITKSILKKNKKNFFNFEIYVKQKEHIHKLKEIEKDIIDLFNPLINNLIKNFENHSFILTKGK
jgi:hypothetical protein